MNRTSQPSPGWVSPPSSATPLLRCAMCCCCCCCQILVVVVVVVVVVMRRTRLMSTTAWPPLRVDDGYFAHAAQGMCLAVGARARGCIASWRVALVAVAVAAAAAAAGDQSVDACRAAWWRPHVLAAPHVVTAALTRSAAAAAARCSISCHRCEATRRGCAAALALAASVYRGCACLFHHRTCSFVKSY